MNKLRSGLSSLLTLTVLCGGVLCFDTGPHSDLTRSVLSERGFSDDALKTVQLENWLTDYYAGTPTISRSKRTRFEKLHFDNLFTSSQVANYWAWLINNLKKETQSAARKNDVLAALTVVSVGLHAIQDLYAHSNWVETHPRVPDGAYRSETYPGSPPSEIYTGKFPTSRISGPAAQPIPPNAENHGDYDQGLNKDSLVRPRWDEAYVFGYVASHELVQAMAEWAEEARPGFWTQAQTFTLDAALRKKLDIDITAARNISMWKTSDGADGHWKGNKSGSSGRFRSITLKWVLSASSPMVKQMRSGNVPKAISANLYANYLPPQPPALPKFTLPRRVVIVRSTMIGAPPGPVESDGSGPPDYYSLITIGTQEFWGRTLRSGSKAVDPWCEIFFTGAETIPIRISIRNEDDTDTTNDRSVDINPLAGKDDLDVIFEMESGKISGDLFGRFNSPETAFFSWGEKPDKHRASIAAYIVQRPLR